MIFLVYSLFFINSFLIVGNFITSNFSFKNNETTFSEWGRNFISLTIGIFTIVVLYAIFKSNGITIFSIGLIPLIILIWFNKIKFKYQKFIRFKPLIKVNLILIIYFLVMYFSSFSNFELRKEFHPDLHFYENISYFLSKGYENCLKNLNEVYFKYATIREPYHYFELWLCSLMGEMTQQKSFIYAFQLGTTPILLTVTTVGLLAIWEKYNVLNNWNYLVFGILMIFTGAISNFLTEPILNLFEAFFSNKTIVFESRYHLNYFLLVKNLPFYIISILCVLLFLENKVFNSIIVLIFALIINVGLLPGISTAVFIFSVYYFLIKKREFLLGFILLFCLFLVLISFLAFYGYFNIANSGMNLDKSIYSNYPIYKFSSNLSIKGELIRMIIRIAAPIAYLVVIYFPYLFLFYLMFKKKMPLEIKNIAIITILLLFGGLLTRPFLFGLNSTQFLSYLLPFLNVFIILLIAIFYQNWKKSIFVIFIIGFLSNFLQINTYINENDGKIGRKKYSDQFIKQVEHVLCKKYSERIGWIMSEEEQKKYPKIFWMYSAPCNFINTIGIHNYCNLNDPFLNANRNEIETVYTDQLKFQKGKSYNNRLISFIRKYNVKFVFVKNGVNLKNYTFLKFTFLFKDELSGVSFYKIN